MQDKSQILSGGEGAAEQSMLEDSMVASIREISVNVCFSGKNAIEGYFYLVISTRPTIFDLAETASV